MPRRVAALVFFSLVTLIVAGLHGYLWVRLVADTALGAPWSLVATVALAGLAVGTPLFLALVNAARPLLSRLLGYPIFTWVGLFFLLFALLLAGDLLQGIAWAVQKLAGLAPWSADPQRGLLVARATAGGALALALCGTLWGLRNGLAAAKVCRLEVTLARLPPALDGFTIAQITDLHLTARRGARWLAGIVVRTNALCPDLVAITGDLVDGSVRALAGAAAPLAGLRAPVGVFFVTGNHDYYSGAEAWIDELRRLGVRALRNERVSVGAGAASFDLAGVDDHSASGMLPGHGPDLSRALVGRDPSRELVLLAHQPRAIHEAAERGVGLQLSGHTHGGQIWPFHHLVRLQQPYLSGLIQHGSTQLYVSEGTGYWGPPLRLRTRAEIALITLRAPDRPTRS